MKQSTLLDLMKEHILARIIYEKLDTPPLSVDFGNEAKIPLGTTTYSHFYSHLPDRVSVCYFFSHKLNEQEILSIDEADYIRDSEGKFTEVDGSRKNIKFPFDGAVMKAIGALSALKSLEIKII